MEDKKKKSVEEHASSQAAVERGKKAVKADEEINKKNLQDPKVKEDKEKDAEQWRNEG
jgi:hypothetical protein